MDAPLIYEESTPFTRAELDRLRDSLSHEQRERWINGAWDAIKANSPDQILVFRRETRVDRWRVVPK